MGYDHYQDMISLAQHKDWTLWDNKLIKSTCQHFQGSKLGGCIFLLTDPVQPVISYCSVYAKLYPQSRFMSTGHQQGDTGQLAKVAMRSMKSKRLLLPCDGFSLATVGHMMTPEHTPYAKEDIEAESHEKNMVKFFSSFFYF